jgi:membrane-bound serine protease (ClpP class)
MVALGLLLLTVAVMLVLAEAHLSTGGLIASGALVALLSGVTLLLVGSGAGLVLVLAVGVSVAAVSFAALLVAARSLLSVRRLRPRSGPEGMVGHLGVVRAGDSPPRVFIDGGLWRAQPSLLESGSPLQAGDTVVVERVRGLTLSVRRAEEWELVR